MKELAYNVASNLLVVINFMELIKYEIKVSKYSKNTAVQGTVRRSIVVIANEIAEMQIIDTCLYLIPT